MVADYKNPPPRRFVKVDGEVLKEVRRWGSFNIIDSGKRFKIKKLIVKPGKRLSLQRHYHRAEHWIVIVGTVIVTKGSEEILLTEDQSIYIPINTVHRLYNPGKIDLEIVEVQTGTYLEEDDIVRLEDDYERK